MIQDDLPLPFPRSADESLDETEPPKTSGIDVPVGDLIDLHPTDNDIDLEDNSNASQLPELPSDDLDAVVEDDDNDDSLSEDDFNILEAVEKFQDRGTFPS